MDNSSYQVFCGIDVGKTSHYAVALNREGERLAGSEVPQNEAALRRLFTDLTRHGEVLLANCRREYRVRRLEVR